MTSVDQSTAHTQPSALAGVLMLAGLAGLAFTQPILDLMGRNPEFFVAGRYSAAQIVGFAVVVGALPTGVLGGLYLGARLLGRRPGVVVLTVLLGVLGGVFGNVVVRSVGSDRLAVAALAAALGAGAAIAAARTRGGALLLQYLAAAQVLFLVGFLFVSPTSRLLQEGVGPEAIGTVTVPELPGPVVMIVFDELPIASLMTSDGEINASRYPQFARLAASTTWYRNASSVADRTERGVPAILTGVEFASRSIPRYDDMPRNVLSLLSRAVPVTRYEAITDLCPPDACEARPGQSLRNALRDSLIVYGHRVLPARLRDGLAPIDDAWGDFGDGVAVDQDGPVDEFEDGNPLARFHNGAASERDAATQNLRLAEIGLGIDGSPRLHFAHVVTPHAPWSTTPWGHRVLPPWPGVVEDASEPGYEWSQVSRYQRHSLQLGAVDVVLGQVLDQLDETGAFDDATIVVTADHGISMLGPDLGRTGTDNNKDEIYRVPLFLKFPGESGGRVVDDVAQTIDILPTLIDALGVETDWDFDGHSLLDGSGRTAELDVDADLDGLYTLIRRHEAQFPTGTDWDALFAVGEHGELVGTPVAELVIGDESDIEWDLENEDAWKSLPTEQGEVPQVVRGRIRTPDGSPPPPLVVVANGIVAGVTGTYGQWPDGWSFSATLGNHFVDGENTVAAYEVTDDRGTPVLHRVS